MRVVVAEDHALLRDGLVRILQAHGHEVVAAVGDADALLQTLDVDQADVAVVDVRMPPTFTDEGLRGAIQARLKRPGFPVLVLSQYVEQLYARELLGSGQPGVGYLLKDRVADVSQFIEAVQTVASGGTVLDPEVVASLIARSAPQSPVAALTQREREVLEMMAQGRSNSAIAEALFITEKTVAKNSSNIFMKLGLEPDDSVNRRVQAVIEYLRS